MAKSKPIMASMTVRGIFICQSNSSVFIQNTDQGVVTINNMGKNTCQM